MIFAQRFIEDVLTKLNIIDAFCGIVMVSVAKEAS